MTQPVSRTQYKDELIRVAQLLGLPDGVDPLEVAQAVADRLAQEPAAPAPALMPDMSARLVTVVEEAANRLERGRGKVANSQAYADMTLTMEYLRSELTAAQNA